MVAATEEFAVATAGGRIAGTMAADVIKASQDAIVATHDEQRLSDEVEGKVVARARGLMHMTDDLPRGGEDPGLFLLVSCRTKIKGCRQGGSTRDVAIGL